MDGEVDAVGGEGVFDFLDEDAFTVKRRAVLECGGWAERGVLHAVAGGADDLDGDFVAAGAEEIRDMVRLPECELGAACADAECGGAHRYKDTRVRECGSAGEILARAVRG